MPTIRPYTAQGSNYVPNVPGYIHPDPEGAAISSFGRSFQETERTGVTIAQIGEKIQQQTDENKYFALKSRFDTGLKAINLSLETDPEVIADASVYAKKYTDAANVLVSELKQDADPRVSAAFSNYVTNTLPSHIIVAQGVGLKKQEQQASAGLMTTLDQLSNEYAQALTPDGRENAQQAGLGAISRYYGRGFGNPGDKVKAEKAFRNSNLEKKMYEIARANPDDLAVLLATPEYANVDIAKKTQAREAALRVREHQQLLAKQQEVAIHKEAMQNAVSRAGDKMIPESEIEDIIAYKDPILLPSDGLTLRSIQNAKSTTADDNAIEIIFSEWSTARTQSIKTDEKALAELDKLRRDQAAGGIVNHKISQYANQIHAVQRARESTGRAVTGAGYRDLAVEKKRAETLYESQLGPLPSLESMRKKEVELRKRDLTQIFQLMDGNIERGQEPMSANNAVYTIMKNRADQADVIKKMMQNRRPGQILSPEEVVEEIYKIR